MEDYNVWGDALNKLSQLTPWVQAVIGLGFFGMVVALAYFTKECVVAVMRPFYIGRNPASSDLRKEIEDND
jgi:hypothetical protein